MYCVPSCRCFLPNNRGLDVVPLCLILQMKGKRSSSTYRERRLLLQRPEHEVGTFHYPGPRQDENFVAQQRIGVEKPIILGNSNFGGVTPLSICKVKLRPRWRKKHASMVTVSLTKLLKYRLTCLTLKSNSSIDQASVANCLANCQLLGIPVSWVESMVCIPKQFACDIWPAQPLAARRLAHPHMEQPARAHSIQIDRRMPQQHHRSISPEWLIHQDC
jgi:hypothetical protein